MKPVSIILSGMFGGLAVAIITVAQQPSLSGKHFWAIVVTVTLGVSLGLRSVCTALLYKK